MTVRRLLLPVCVFLLCVVGCGSSDWGSVDGSVTLDDAALEAANIAFIPVGEGPTAYGKVINGQYTISTGQKSGAKVGRYVVTISALTIPKMGTNEKAKNLTPTKYATKETSGLEAEVKAGSNTLNFKLTAQK